MDESTKQEPYMGMIRVGHRDGQTYLHGSDVSHYQTISLTISRGTEERRYNENVYYDLEQLIQVEMTPLQWLELITNPNTGCGTPCTLRRVLTEGKIEQPEQQQLEIDKAQNEFKIDIDKLPEKLNDLNDAIEQIKMPIKSKKFLQGKVNMIKQELYSNLPFAFQQFKEATEHLLAEAKATAETYIGNALFRLGLKTAKHLQDESDIKNVEEIE